MPLTSRLFSGDQALEDCLILDPRHVVPGAQGLHVAKIQKALITLGAGVISEGEITGMVYGDTTARSVLSFKGPPRNILNIALGQTTPDNIVGKNTIRILDKEIFDFQNRPASAAVSLFVSLTPDGSPHDHTTCPLEFKGQRQVDHRATAINPGLGRKVNLGGEGELQYLGFEDFVADPNVVAGPPRPLLDTIAAATVSDVAVRSAPITERAQAEIRRIAAPKCRITVATNSGVVPSIDTIMGRIGAVIIERISLPDPTSADGLGLQIFVAVMP
jgi:hypothetical protein